ncbi:HupE/UreJ family protein [Adhaeribacter rhizoryzae]|uniref:HupE/UreJ family protein n=1 Tax=Adhaeribacter rhizoryzae TaxID=2607907 RepID=A0A5M6D2D1_9BACT|nr:HupE/UreJ family protein [Adhaeribacter rhizoryzae]KAA5541166.1 HupE/UreJ family protein [Adhaeribacter rhizoryzae]
MQDFPLYFQLGITHILDWQGYDHILFVMALCGVYGWQDWRKLLILVTAFTVGHSLTLALSVFNLIPVSVSLIEFLIPVTIVITSLVNILRKNQNKSSWLLTYLLTLLFGLIHGMGFSNYLKSLLGSQVAGPLLAFNVGLEVGQLAIVFITLTLSFLVLNGFRASRREWNLFLSSAIFGIALTMSLERLGALFS